MRTSTEYLLSKGRATVASSRRSVVRSRIHVLQREIHIWHPQMRVNFLRVSGSPEKALLEPPEQVRVHDLVIPELGRVLFIIKIYQEHLATLAGSPIPLFILLSLRIKKGGSPVNNFKNAAGGACDFVKFLPSVARISLDGRPAHYLPSSFFH